MFIAVSRLVLQIPESGSLKAKRQVVRRVTDRLRARFNVAVAEVGDNDLWQRAVLGLGVVGNDRRHVDEQMGKIIHAVEEMYVAPLISRQTEILAFGDSLFSTAEVRTLADAEAEEEEEGEGLLDVEASFDLEAHLARGDRSMAEAEGMEAWEARRPEPKKDRQEIPKDDARAKARALRNPRDWEKS